jgi:hypothetical protein
MSDDMLQNNQGVYQHYEQFQAPQYSYVQVPIQQQAAAEFEPVAPGAVDATVGQARQIFLDRVRNGEVGMPELLHELNRHMRAGATDNIMSDDIGQNAPPSAGQALNPMVGPPYSRVVGSPPAAPAPEEVGREGQVPNAINAAIMPAAGAMVHPAPPPVSHMFDMTPFNPARPVPKLPSPPKFSGTMSGDILSVPLWAQDTWNHARRNGLSIQEALPAFTQGNARLHVDSMLRDPVTAALSQSDFLQCFVRQYTNQVKPRGIAARDKLWKSQVTMEKGKPLNDYVVVFKQVAMDA